MYSFSVHVTTTPSPSRQASDLQRQSAQGAGGWVGGPAAKLRIRWTSEISQNWWEWPRIQWRYVSTIGLGHILGLYPLNHSPSHRPYIWLAPRNRFLTWPLMVFFCDHWALEVNGWGLRGCHFEMIQADTQQGDSMSLIPESQSQGASVSRQHMTVC